MDYAASFGYLASEAAEVEGEVQDADSGSKLHSLPSSKSSTVVFTWGLNDKDQLGGIKGSKIKAPTLSDSLSKLNVAQVAGKRACLADDGMGFQKTVQPDGIILQWRVNTSLKDLYMGKKTRFL